MTKKKRVKKITSMEPHMSNLYRKIYDGTWANIKASQLLKEDPRFLPHEKNIWRTLNSAKKRVQVFKRSQTGKQSGPSNSCF